MKTIFITTITLAMLAPAVAASEEWASLSSNVQSTYLVDLADIKRDGDVAAVRVARVFMDRTRDEDGYHIQTLEFRCEGKQSRNPLTVDYGPDGSELDRYEDTAAGWDQIPSDSLDDYTRAIACDAVRPAGQTWPSIKAYMDFGRPGG